MPRCGLRGSALGADETPDAAAEAHGGQHLHQHRIPVGKGSKHRYVTTYELLRAALGYTAPVILVHKQDPTSNRVINFHYGITDVSLSLFGGGKEEKNSKLTSPTGCKAKRRHC